jgi:hypothetical protein
MKELLSRKMYLDIDSKLFRDVIYVPWMSDSVEE